ncbi:phage tail protein [Glaesserella parasuis]|nr:phage tail protein [Glaesserella parasuis]QSX14347.1 phage tail protein [Glaesserella parasuis]
MRFYDYGIDKFQLYQIAQYCDQQVPDGYGGQEPRMVANLWLTEQRDAYSVISDMASVFRAIVVWNGTQLTAIQDRNADPVCSFTQANVIDGKFNRQYVPLKSIFTAVEVEYADERNNYQKAIEYVADDAMIKRYGYNVKKIVAFACTSRGQARRYGKWVLETSRLEQCTISFSVGREGLQVLPGDIIEIADKFYANVNLGGRVLAINGRTVTLDAPIEVAGEKYLSYLVNDNNGQRLVRRKISQINAQNKSLVTLDSEPTGLQVMDTWALHTPLVSTQRYRVLGVAENEDGSYGITALQHEPQKERIVDEGAFFAPASETLHKVEPQLTHLGVQPTLSGDMKVSWEVTSGNGTVKYDIKVLKDGKLYLFKRDESSSELNLADLANGEYQVTIIARDAQGRMLSEKVQSFTIDNPPAPKNVSVSGGLSGITLSWDFVDEATQTEIWASSTNNLANAERIAKVTANMYTHNVGPRQTRYYWLRHTRGINVGEWYQQQGLSAETGADIDAELALLNEKLGQNIIDEVFDTAMPARKLEMTKTVARIDNPTENIGYKQLYNEADGKLYVWDGRKYTAKVQAVDLEGKLASSQLDQALINQLTTASSTANNALSKANTVQSALAQEVNRRTQAIQAEANARGTAVSRLEQADREQAQLITTATAKADNALSGLSEERQARIAGDKAQSEQLVALTSRLGTAEATISSTSRTVTTLDGKVQSMHTIQAVSIAGNRKALAGISLGSNGGTESSVIVMADKFNVVKNARDGNVKPMFSVVNNKVAINGDLMADGIVSARMMGANSIAAGSIQGGAVRANHVAVGELTADKFAVGLGGNLLLNPIFANVNVVDGIPHGWAKGTVNGTVTFRANSDKNYGLRSMGLPNENCILIRRTDISTTNYAELVQVVPVNRRMWYMASVYMGNHRCVKTELIIEYLNANGTAISATHKTGGNGFTGLETAERVFIKFQAPVNCEKVRFCLRQTGITARNTNAIMLVARPMLEECTAHTRGPSPWKNSGVTAIHGGSIVTRSITAEQIEAGTITGKEIASKAISADHLSVKSVNANHIATRTLTADKLNINSLSAISANLGAVTAGSININNRFKVNTSGQVEMRSATANVGMVINNDQIVVYDEQGRVRVKIGRL